MSKTLKILSLLLLLAVVAGTVQSCSKRKCDGNRRTKVPMGYM